MRDKIVKHGLAVDKILKPARKEMETIFEKKVFTKDGYKKFKKHTEKFLDELQNEFARRMLEAKIPQLLKVSEEYLKEVKGV